MFWLKTAFLGHEWSVVGPHTLFRVWWTQKNVFCNVLEQFIECLEPPSPKNRISCQKQTCMV